MASTAGDIITGALLNINSYSPGEPLQATDAQVGLNGLNDLLDSLSNDEAFVYTQNEINFQWIPGKYQYTVGNPVGGTFVGTLTLGSNIITGVSIPANLAVGGTLTDPAGALPVGLAAGVSPALSSTPYPPPTVVTSIGANTVTMSAAPTLTPGAPVVITYTVPGDIPMVRPLRFRQGFTRANTSGSANLDYTFNFTDYDNYKRELLKNIQGPWPYIAAYLPYFPYGIINVYPAPGSNYTAHIFYDMILSEFASTTSAFNLPPGYTRALKKLLALELAPTYGKTPSPELRLQAKEAKALLMGTNASPVPVMQFDSAISRSQTQDAGWIQSGGF